MAPTPTRPTAVAAVRAAATAARCNFFMTISFVYGSGAPDGSVRRGEPLSPDLGDSRSM